MMLIKRLAGAAGLGLLLTAVAPAQGAGVRREDAPQDEARGEALRVGLVIANAAYPRGELADVVDGATAVAEALRQGGFDVVYAENARRTEMEAAIDAFGRKLERGAFAVVYFSGRAVRNLGRNFLAPVDARLGPKADVARETVDIDTILDPLIVAKPVGAVVILDASRANPWPQSQPEGVRGLAAPEPIQSVSFFYSAEPGKVVAHGPDSHGARDVFAAELARSMSTVGLSLDGVFRETRAAVKRDTDDVQVPWESSPPPKDLIITEARKVPLRPADPVEQGFWDTIKNSETAADFQAYLDAYPNGPFAMNARARLKQIGESHEPATAGLAAARTGAAAEARIRDCPQCPEMVLIHAGAFEMGSDEMFPFEGPVHRVAIARDFYMGRREVTFDEWDACVAEGGCGRRPSDRGLGRGLRPVTDLDWEDAKEYTRWLSKRTGHAYRLPSESEWEYAARGGLTTTYPWGAAVGKDRANCIGCTSQPLANTVATGSYPANGFGLFDMCGNAAEWVEDCWSDGYRGAPGDGSAWNKPQCRERVLRGGSFNNDPRYLRSAARFKYDYDVRYYTNGFRVVRQD